MYVTQQNLCLLYNLHVYRQSAEPHISTLLYACTGSHACARTLLHIHARTRTHTLTQFSKELNSQSCIDEEQQHEEQTQIPHLDRHITRTNRYIV